MQYAESYQVICSPDCVTDADLAPAVAEYRRTHDTSAIADDLAEMLDGDAVETLYTFADRVASKLYALDGLTAGECDAVADFGRLLNRICDKYDERVREVL